MKTGRTAVTARIVLPNASESRRISNFLNANDIKTTGDQVREVIEDPRRALFVAKVDGEIVAWAKTHFYEQPSGEAPAGNYLGGIVVAPGWRRTGIAQRLIAARAAWLDTNPRAGNHHDQVHFVVNAMNHPSIHLHEPFGFREAARGRDFHGVTFSGVSGAGNGILFSAELGGILERWKLMSAPTAKAAEPRAES
ncbi:GNAT family N-acetyltransferase [Haematomicrobium sanguinis]|uniref:GNAT family N-acetyltransferase n=1 Tax=Haematomicrobium sanguinis TaxID=479106 RepID=UPI00068C53BA|nr:GNAT family N-acetyltransferase [Haematomicrobium sanguinis]